MKLWDFFDEVYQGYISEFDMLSRVEKMTDQFDTLKLNLLCQEFDFYCFMAREEYLGSFSHKEIENKMHEIEKAGKKIPVESDNNRSSLSVNNFFVTPEHKKIKREKKWTNEDLERFEKFASEMKINMKKTLDVEKMMDPHGIEFYSLYRLRNLLIKLKSEHTSAELRPEFKAKFDSSKSGQESSSSNTKAIHWLKGEESLKQFLDSLKIGGLIENRGAEEIIQEHFYVDGQEPAKEPKPIKWLIESKYLAYLMDRLGDEFIINIKGSKHKLTASHFINSEGKKLNVNSLSSLLSQINKHSRSTDKRISKIQDIIQKVKS